ncbi:MAG: tetratricopeptide repeat protein [Gemmatimonadales bacterium]|nr:tetratricopeptide repeat protein [Gemmatimonadales bacterium]NIN11235.1 tetratricopeptide repeat protein [Gemmatimonadales bacterium]NIN49834.1 tetratricopeptide repeat protein [Gemmatimonadales bacterium]NIP07298.1 tetratricopeptide repeat protein [Gemmatimonadales bacterium]NIR02993.1 tetratricopeptide repeat protein [Gemmatimonadales bacterium]
MRKIQLLLLGFAAAAPSSACTAGPRVTLPASYEVLLSRVQVDSTDPVAHYHAALAYWSRRRWHDVERELTRALAIEPQYGEAYMALAFLPHARLDELAKEERRTGDPNVIRNAMARGEQMYRRAVLIDPFVEHQIVSAVGLEPATPVTVETGGYTFFIMARGPFQVAVDHFYKGEYDQAFRDLTHLLAAHANEPHKIGDGVFWYRALAAVQLGNYGAALRDMQLLLERATRREEHAGESSSFLQATEYRYVLGCLEYRAGRLNFAMDLLQEAVRFDPSLYMAHVRLADIHEHHQRWLDALDARRAALSLAPDNTSLRRDLALTLYRAGQTEEAAAVLSAVTEQKPVHPLVWYYLGVALQDLEQSAEARRAFQRFLSIGPSRYAEHRADAEVRLSKLPLP